ncbi:hypothetical protein B0W44_00950 [Novibacillus thermophilus]|uniref:Amidase domain-containing protein n=1 Tax=Novibacillus thermophilus TaxID=1471761 RepID=A0A1U9K3H0_9BACL|nr:hypothetical protein B0W44_00950 [Novibacillus thermophilus]
MSFNMDYTVLTFPTNTIIASQSSLPAISVPVGFKDQGIPVGMELIGKPYGTGCALSILPVPLPKRHHKASGGKRSQTENKCKEIPTWHPSN